jgi:hypothetical protein
MILNVHWFSPAECWEVTDITSRLTCVQFDIPLVGAAQTLFNSSAERLRTVSVTTSVDHFTHGRWRLIRMTTYNWDLIERLLHEVQKGAPSFTPRHYAEVYAAEKATAGELTETLDHLKAVAGEYEKLLLARGYIDPRPEDQGGTGENYILTARGSSLLSLIDSSIPGNDHPRQVLDEQEDPLDEVKFDQVTLNAQIA